MYQELSSDYDAFYQAHLNAFGRRLKETYCDHTKYTDFYPSLGVKAGEPVEFILYGQSVGGWIKEHDYAIPVPSDRVVQSRAYSNRYHADHSPLDWVNVLWTKQSREQLDPAGKAFYKPFGSYNPGRSPFWQLIVRVVQQHCGLPRASWAWTEKLVWSNLYKIAPQDGKAWNPDPGQRILQRPEAVHLVEQEFKELRPRYCIVYTNDSWWAPFRKGLRTETLKVPKAGFVERVERWGDTRIVVVKRARVGSKAAVDHVMEHLV